jgi:two-component system sensor histidine kinase/response regulator
MSQNGEKDSLRDNARYSLLVVDDNEMNRNLMSLQLTRRGYQTDTAESGIQALNMMEEKDYDLILLDIMMPGMSGLEVLEIIRKKHTLISLPVIMVTADDLQESIVDALQRGANDYLIKPLSMPVTIARIKSQLTSKDLATLKDEFVRFASHDLKKPLIVIEDVVDTLIQECKAGQSTPEDIQDLLQLIKKTGENMEQIISGFLDTKKLQSADLAPDYKPAQLNELVEKSIQANANYARKKGVRLEEELDPDLPTVAVDEFRITQVLDNLIGNAMKFSPSDTTTTVRTRSDSQYVYAEVCDGGPGLTEEDMQKLFHKHAALSNRPTGGETSTGVGLHLSKQFIELHQGQIGARNNTTHGATFWFGVPIKHNS